MPPYARAITREYLAQIGQPQMRLTVELTWEAVSLPVTLPLPFPLPLYEFRVGNCR
jgi:hypothetical protein